MPEKLVEYEFCVTILGYRKNTQTNKGVWTKFQKPISIKIIFVKCRIYFCKSFVVKTLNLVNMKPFTQQYQQTLWQG